MTFRITTLSITAQVHYDDFPECECHDLCIVMVNAIMLSVVMMNVIMLSVVMMNVIMLSVIMLSVVAPNLQQ